MKRFFTLIFAFLCCLQPAFGAKKFTISGQSVGSQPVQPSCAAAIELVTFLKDAKCIGFDAAYAYAVKNPNSQSDFVISGTHIRAGSIENNDMAIVMIGGQCKAGEPAGTFTVPLRYVNSESGAVLQVIRTAQQVTASYGGCEVRGVSEDGLCVGFPRDGVSLLNCGVVLQETGNDGGPNSSPDDSAPDYSGGGTGGTNPGGDGGGTGGGDTGGGTGGGNGGGDGGTGGGDGGTGGDGGSGGDGGTGGDGGSGGNGGSGGSGGGSCGGPGQSPCKIDETGTPDGKGLFDRLTEALDSLANGIQAGVDSATSGDGKDTRISLGFQRPDATCTDPSVDVPVLGRSFSIPICQYISMIGMGFDALWSVFFIFAVMGLVSRATAKPIA